MRRLLSQRELLRCGAVLVYLGIWGLLLTLGAEFLITQFGADDPSVSWLFVLLAGAKFGALPIVVISALIAHRRYYRPNVLSVLREMGYEACGNCGYFLCGLREDVTHCPECGEAREAPLVSVHRSEA